MTAPIIENNYTGDGSTVLFSFTFEYIETVDVEVSIDNVTVPTTSYSLANSTTVEFNTAPAVGAAIRIYRNTTVNDPKATFFPGSAIRAQDLNDNFEQILFVTQEADAIAERAETAADQAQIATTAAQAAASSATAAANQAQSQVNAAQAAAAAAAADANTATTDAAAAVTTANAAVATANTANTNSAAAATNAAAATSAAQTATTAANNASADAAAALASATTAAAQATSAATSATSAQTSATAAQASAVIAASDAAAAATTANNANSTANTASSDASTALTAANNAVSTANTASSNASTANTNASAAVTTANAASTAAGQAVTTANNAAADATSAISTANTAQTTANSAVTTANTADTNASAATTTANSASTAAASAVTTANAASAAATQASTDAASAVSTANSASTAASNAVSTANTADSNASTALSTANTAATNASTAVTTANAASTTANNAASLATTAANTVAGSYLFTPVAAVANIPTNPSNNDAVRVSNSTGIQNSSVVQGLPSGFVGDSGINVEILYSSSASKWNFVKYNANDPDDRYGYPPYVDVTRQNTVDAATLSGRPLNSTHLGTFTGSIISDNTTVKTALQELETEVETKADLVGGVVPTSQLPALAITTFLGSVANQTAMLALSGQRGDFAIRTDTGTTFVLTSDGGSSLSHWQELATPTDAIQTVNGQAGTVVLGASDVGAVPLAGAATKSSGNLTFNDNVKAQFGGSGDLQIHHDGTHSRINDNGSGALLLQTNGGSIQLNKGTSENMLIANIDADVELYYDGNKKLATKSDGVDITGELQCDSLDVDGLANIQGSLTVQSDLLMGDSDKIKLGNNDDLQIYHDGNNSYVLDNGTGELRLNSDNVVRIRKHDNETMASFTANGAVELRYDNSTKFVTKSDGIGVTGEVECTFLDVNGNADISGNLTIGGLSTVHGDIDLQDNDKILLGTGNDLQIYHDNQNSYIKEEGTGELRLGSNNVVRITKHDSETLARFDADGGVTLYHDNSKKFETASGGATVTGTFTATGNIEASNNIHVGDSKFFLAGASNDLQIQHDSSNTHIHNYTGGLYITNDQNDGDVILRSDNGSGGLSNYVVCDGSDGNVRLYYYGSEKLQTKSDGVVVTGEVQMNSLDVNGPGDFTDDCTFRGGAAAAYIAPNSDIRFGSGTWTGEVGNNNAKIQCHSNNLYNQAHGSWIFRNGSGHDKIVVDQSGNLVASGNVTAFSDIRLKKDIELIPNALDKVLSLRGVTYTDIESDDRRTGVIAQEVQSVLPEAVQENKEYLSVAYGNLVGLLIESVKELEARVRELEGR